MISNKINSLIVLASLGLASACGDNAQAPADTTSPDATSPDVTAPDSTSPDSTSPDTTAPDTTAPPPEGPCDPLDPAHCTFPFPSNLYLTPDPTRTTGFTLDFGAALPRSTAGFPIDSAPYRRMDGYGVGTPLLVSFPNLDFTGLATEYHTAPSLAPDAPIIWLEDQGTTFRRVAYFVDNDTLEPDPAQRTLIVRPAEILKEGTRYLVAFRNLKDHDGTPYPPSAAFAALRAGHTTDPALAPRQARFDRLFADLTAAGVATADLQLAWDFNTASCDALHGPARHMVDDALAVSGPQGPALSAVHVTEVQDDPHWALEVTGVLAVPAYLDPVTLPQFGSNAWHLHYGPDGLPAQVGTQEASFWIRIPKSAIPAPGEAAIPHGLVLYGHGQNGSGQEVRAGHLGVVADTYHYVLFATDMWGMSATDLPTILESMSDMSQFQGVADRLHQGLVNHVVLARAIREQLPTLPALTERGIVLDPTRLTYSGISQGGIYGASIVALSPDIQRGHLGVPGNNYQYLLTRSRNFESFFSLLSQNYLGRTTHLTVLATIEQLWEGADPVSYFRHLHAEPFPGQGPNEVLLAPAKGDVQVPVTSNEWIARSAIGVPVMAPYDRDRPAPSGAETATYPRQGSGIVLYDFGNPWPAESESVPPTSDVADPHSMPRRAANHARQLAHFLDTGEIIDVCSDDGAPGCTPD